MPPNDPASSHRPRLADHAGRVAPFQWKLLIGFLVLGIVGAGVYGFARVSAPAAGVSKRVAETPAGARGFLGTDPSADRSAEKEDDAPVRAADTWTGWAGAKGATLGFGFVGGFIVGFVFRAFLKIMTLATLVIVGGLTALSYYGVLNIDFTQARDVVQSNAEWLTDQATRLKDMVIAHLPSSTGGAAGAFFGLRRR